MHDVELRLFRCSMCHLSYAVFLAYPTTVHGRENRNSWVVSDDCRLGVLAARNSLAAKRKVCMVETNVLTDLDENL